MTFATADEMLSHITPTRVRLCEVAREKPRSITELAAVLQRDRKSVHRDVQALHSVGILLVQKKPNPGHGQVQVVTAAASRWVPRNPACGFCMVNGHDTYPLFRHSC